MAKSKNSTDLRTIRISELKQTLQMCFASQRAAFIWGPPGIGKSDVIEQIGKANGRPVIDMRLLLMEPTDIKGIPYYNPNDNTMRWAPPSDLPKEDETELHNSILFLDELNSAPTSVQAAAYQLILNRRVGEYKLPDGVSIVAAGNRDTDRGVTYRMPKPLSNRFVHFELICNFEDWQEWAIDAGIHSDVVGFLSHHKQKLDDFDPKSPERAFATPRSWTFVSQLLTTAEKQQTSIPLVTTMVSGCVGDGKAIEFMAHRKVASKMPKASDILNGKVKKFEVDEISAKYSLTINLCYEMREAAEKLKDPTSYDKKEQVSEDDFHKMGDYFLQFMMDNFEPEMVILGARTALRQYKLPFNHKKLKTFSDFFKKYEKYVFFD